MHSPQENIECPLYTLKTLSLTQPGAKLGWWPEINNALPQNWVGRYQTDAATPSVLREQ